MGINRTWSYETSNFMAFLLPRKKMVFFYIILSQKIGNRSGKQDI